MTGGILVCNGDEDMGMKANVFCVGENEGLVRDVSVAGTDARLSRDRGSFKFDRDASY